MNDQPFDWNSYEQEFELYTAVAQIQEVLDELNILMTTDITTAIRGVSSGIDAVKKLADLAVKTQNIELREGILNLREQLLEAKDALLDAKEQVSSYKQENATLKAENTKLKEELENGQEKELEFSATDSLYHDKNDYGGLFCTACYDSKKQKNRVIENSRAMQRLGKYKCPVCNALYNGSKH
jgi:regulator of replication initiation timing